MSVTVTLLYDSEQEILRDEVNSLQAVREKLKSRITELEEELKHTKEDLDKQKKQTTGEDDVSIIFFN